MNDKQNGHRSYVFGLQFVVMFFALLSASGLLRQDVYAGRRVFCDSVTQIARAECDALAALFGSTNGDHWKHQDGWLSSPTPCTWYGLYCGSSPTPGKKTIISLQLESNELKGTIPAEIGDLTSLQTLSLHDNQLTGQIPKDVGRLTNLTRLFLSRNYLTGTIPPDIGQLAKLETLSLAINELEGPIPTEVGDLTNLRELYLHVNLLEGSIPAKIGQLSQLEELILYANNVGGSIPPEIGNLTNLTQLNLDDNELTGPLPAEMGDLAKVKFIYISDNKLVGSLPPQLGNLRLLEELHLTSNQLDGTIPAEMSGMASLGGLWVNNNKLRGPFPASVAEMHRLSVMDLSYNAMYANNSHIEQLLNEKDQDWQDTQTVAPVGLTAVPGSLGVTITWNPIKYIGDGGYYEVWYAPAGTANFALHGTTTTKADSSYLVTGLEPDSQYAFSLRTFTPAHGAQPNNIWSDFSKQVEAVVPANTPTPTQTSTPSQTPTPTPIPTATVSCSDAYEPDDEWFESKLLVPNAEAQRRTFHRPGDVDFAKVLMEVRKSYSLFTSELAQSVDTVLTLLDTDGTTVLDLNDDDPSNPPASWLAWTASRTGSYFVRVKNLNPNVGGCGMTYSLSVATIVSEPSHRVWLPTILRQGYSKVREDGG